MAISSVMFPSFHILSLFSNVFRWSFAFDFLIGFCSIFSSGFWFGHRCRNLELLSMNFLPATPVGIINIFLSQYTIWLYFFPDLSDIPFQERCSNNSLHAAVLVLGLRYRCFHLIRCCCSRWDLRCFFGGIYSNVEEVLLVRKLLLQMWLSVRWLFCVFAWV